MKYRRLDGFTTTADDPERSVWYSASCSWWTDEWDRLLRGPGGMPCCPHCGSVGYATEFKQFTQVANFGDVSLLDCSKNTDTCFKGGILPPRSVSHQKLLRAVPAIDGRIPFLAQSLAALESVLASRTTLPWNRGPAPKDGSIILADFGGTYHVCWWDSWPVGGETPSGNDPGAPPDGYESGWVTDGDNVDGEPVAWCVLP